MLKQHCHWLTDQLIEINQGVVLCCWPTKVVDKTAFWTQEQISPSPQPPAVYRSLERQDDYKDHPNQPRFPTTIILDQFGKSCGWGWELSCHWNININLRQSWSWVIPKPVFVRAEAKHSLRCLQTGFHWEKRRVSEICAVIFMVLVKCVWKPTLSRSCRLWNATKSRMC